MVVGVDSDGCEVVSDVLEGTKGSAPTGMALDELRAKGGEPRFTAHSHPHAPEEVENPNGPSYYVGPTASPSYGDVNVANNISQEFPEFHQSGYQSIVLGNEYPFVTQGVEPMPQATVSTFTYKNNTPVNSGTQLTVNSSMQANNKVGTAELLNAFRNANRDYEKRKNDSR